MYGKYLPTFTYQITKMYVKIIYYTYLYMECHYCWFWATGERIQTGSNWFSLRNTQRTATKITATSSTSRINWPLAKCKKQLGLGPEWSGFCNWWWMDSESVVSWIGPKQLLVIQDPDETLMVIQETLMVNQVSNVWIKQQNSLILSGIGYRFRYCLLVLVIHSTHHFQPFLTATQPPVHPKGEFHGGLDPEQWPPDGW